MCSTIYLILLYWNYFFYSLWLIYLNLYYTASGFFQRAVILNFTLSTMWPSHHQIPIFRDSHVFLTFTLLFWQEHIFFQYLLKKGRIVPESAKLDQRSQTTVDFQPRFFGRAQTFRRRRKWRNTHCKLVFLHLVFSLQSIQVSWIGIWEGKLNGQKNKDKLKLELSTETCKDIVGLFSAHHPP